MEAEPFNISADEVNCLVHGYLRDCGKSCTSSVLESSFHNMCLIASLIFTTGFEHAAFSLRSEARLDKSTNFQKQVPHGELVDLLGRALLFNSVESHPSGRHGCNSPISLLDKHVCSSSGRPPPPAIAPAPFYASPAIPASVSSASFTPAPQVKASSNRLVLYESLTVSDNIETR